MGENTQKKRKVAILGAGVGAMTTAFSLTDPDNPRHDDYDITVYQLGWRVGGKGASGRNMDPDKKYRIEEHGLHVWFGSYDNAFRIMQKAYGELDRPPDSPLASWRDAFKPHSFALVTQFFKGKWYMRPGAFPTNDDVPGEGELLPLWDYVMMGIKLAKRFIGGNTVEEMVPDITGADHLEFPGRTGRGLQRTASWIEDKLFDAFLWIVHKIHIIGFLIGIAERLLLAIFQWYIARRWKKVKQSVHEDADDNWHWTMLNWMYATLNGIVKEELFQKGLDAANGRDYREWLRDYGYPDGGILADSYWVTAIYDGMFAYEDGDNSIPPGMNYPPKSNFEAGVALRIGLRQFLTYKGAAVWKMQASMGEVVFTPIYQCLLKRGVKFKFFHQVQDIKANSDGSRIEEIVVAEQVKIKPEQEAKGGYAPTINVKGIDCWPSTPFYDQIVDGERIRDEGVNLEDPFSGWEPVATKTLRLNEDFDEVVLGISLGGLPYICCDLAKKSTKWKDMLTNVKTCRTMASQLWLRDTAYELGWEMMRQPLLSGLDDNPMDTWSDMTHLVDREAWTADSSIDPDRAFPQNIGYYCGMMIDDPPQKLTECGYVDARHMSYQEGKKIVYETMQEFVVERLKVFFPNAVDANGEFRWELLIDGAKDLPEGKERLKSQFFRANTFPTERYVLSVAGSDKYRLPPHDNEEFVNLYLAGDWTSHRMNVGCVESAVMSALLASNALSGFPVKKDIIGLEW